MEAEARESKIKLYTKQRKVRGYRRGVKRLSRVKNKPSLRVAERFLFFFPWVLLIFIPGVESQSVIPHSECAGIENPN
jgi:hypothetical protein